PPHRILPLSLHDALPISELSHGKDIERRMQFLRNLIRDGNASAWQSKHDSVATVGIVGQFVREEPPGLDPVFENLFEHIRLQKLPFDRLEMIRKRLIQYLECIDCAA